MASSIFSQVQLILFFIIPSLLSINSEITYINQGCSHDYASFDIRSDYEANIHESITQLTSDASKTYFSTNSTGSGLDKVNTLFNCRYDISPQTCRTCVASIATNISWCFPSVESFMIYEECSLLYSNRSTSSVMEDEPWIIQYSYRTSELEEHFSNVLNSTMTNLIGKVISEFDVSSRFFATNTTRYWSTKTIYALAQCNPDITSSSCSACLRSGFAELATNHTAAIYGQYFTPICRLSYILSDKELTRPWKFYDSYNQSRSWVLSSGSRGSSINGAIMVASILSVALSLKLLR